MGCFWSKDGEHIDRCRHCTRKAVNNLNVINGECEVCIRRAVQSTQRRVGSFQSSCKFGEFRCSNCRRSWSSHLVWPGKHQRCNRCRRAVYPHTLRERRPSDMPRGKGAQEHSRELCQMCNELGSYCGNLKKTGKFNK